jgi:hypothetical protein
LLVENDAFEPIRQFTNLARVVGFFKRLRMIARAASDVSRGAGVAMDSTDLSIFLVMTPSYAQIGGGRAGTRTPDPLGVNEVL